MNIRRELVLVADDDEDIVRFVEVNLRLEGFEVTTASDGNDALKGALESIPDLILLDIMMPEMDGYEVCQRLRASTRTKHIPIIMLTAKSLSADKVVGLTAGADDYIIKPFDPVELLARVKGTLRRAREMRALSPLTGLPGNIRVQEEIRRRVAEDEPFSLLYADLDFFKPYNDHYGFVRGDRAIQGLARLINDVVHDMAGPQGFVGHVGGDDFIIIVPPDIGELAAKTLVERFDEVSPSLYDSIDRERGCIEVPDRQGNVKVFPMLALSIGVALTSARRFTHYGEAVTTATELKQFAKRETGSSYALDRRTE
jgi:diguanylate cyclase (GGDEF)-like protein